jgi:uncharacterized membrane protein YoaK (UPF0700 family)
MLLLPDIIVCVPVLRFVSMNNQGTIEMDNNVKEIVKDLETSGSDRDVGASHNTLDLEKDSSGSDLDLCATLDKDEEEDSSPVVKTSMLGFPEEDMYKEEEFKTARALGSKLLYKEKEFKSARALGSSLLYKDKEFKPARITGTKRKAFMSSISSNALTGDYSSREHIFIVCIAMLLSFNSGYTNGTCLSGLLTEDEVTWDSQSTSGFTGAYTLSALSLVDKYNIVTPDHDHFEYFGFQTSMILAFITGSFLSGVMNPRPVPWRLAPTYAPSFFVGAVFIFIAAVLSATENTGRDHYFYFVALANGIQNGISSMYSANLIRTTHLTGTSTDIGLFFAQYVRGNKTNLWKLQILVGLALSFWSGGIVSFYSVKRFESKSLLFNAGIFVLAGLLIVVFLVRNTHISIIRAIRGTWHWQRVFYKLSLRGMDGSAMPEEELLEMFDTMDFKGDGVLDVEELHKGLKDAGMPNLSARNARVMFDVIDTDKDGFVSRNDWFSLVQGKNVIIG